MLTNAEAFKVGFLSRCVEEGLSIEEAHGRVKMAVDKLAGLTDLPGKFLDLLRPVISTGLGYGMPDALVAPQIRGGSAGYTAGKMADVDDTDVGEIKKQELKSEYNRLAKKLVRDKKVRDYRATRKRTGRVFL